MASLLKLHVLILLLLLNSFATASSAISGGEASPECGKSEGSCRNVSEALKFKLIAIASILIASMIGVCLPLFSRAISAFKPEKDLFAVVKAFASGVILATGYMHVLPDSIDSLSSDCLAETPWRRFPFSTFVAMLSAVATLMVDSFSMSYYRKRFEDHEEVRNNGVVGHEILGHIDHVNGKIEEGRINDKGSELIRHRVVAQV